MYINFGAEQQAPFDNTFLSAVITADQKAAGPRGGVVALIFSFPLLFTSVLKFSKNIRRFDCLVYEVAQQMVKFVHSNIIALKVVNFRAGLVKERKHAAREEKGILCNAVQSKECFQAALSSNEWKHISTLLSKYCRQLFYGQKIEGAKNASLLEEYRNDQC
uniref:Uncharacterized protein n=1 Tax=Glossina pallidipes TaxID=7398 RepID=A0A1A9Z978_GLOPL